MLGSHREKCETYLKNGKKHLRILEYNINLAPEKVEMDFSGRFSDNEQLSQQISKTLKENQKMLYAELQSSYAQAFASIHQQLHNRVYSKIPLNEIYLD